ncbi:MULTISPECIES: hypothetical protein [Kitasatospora]|uniref:hypothetical protein n=1 Tax=Kitasatospora TaxID=2063 RepID=UPI0004C3233F|nr:MULTISPECIES: hypothetical protein [unclassified Kitasatospora]WAL71041.1 hypothetical protein OU787_05750 [Kitasatospora sp. YST-16]WNW37079.1 hypothetical protein RKE32_05710 [Streptomyces sp. Li-HN-5-13]
MKNRAALLSVAAALVALGTALPASAAPAPAAAVKSVRSGLDCTTWIHNNDPLTGGVDCTNNTGAAITFHADIVCGWAPDVTGNSVTAQPGQTQESSGHCAFYSTGIGHIGWTVE